MRTWGRKGLWSHAEFPKLWIGETVSLLGSQVTLLALPLTASVMLQASPLQMGVLGASQTIPFLLFGLIAGVWVDRLRRRPIMLVADVGRALLLATIPTAAILGVLHLEQLLVVAFTVGILDVFFGLAYASFLPSLVSRDELPEGNAKLALSAEVARVAGPGLAGALVQVLSAPIAVGVDAASFLVSALALMRINAKEPPPVPASGRRGAWVEMREGFQTVLTQPTLRTLIGTVGVSNLGDGVLFGSGLYVLYTTRELGFEPAALGGIMAGVGVGGLIGAALAGPVTRRWGIGATFLGAQLVWGASYLGAAVVAGPPRLAAVLLAATFALTGVINPIAGANATTLRQAVVADRLQGRVTAIARAFMWTCVTIGAIGGGVAAERIGMRSTIAIAGCLPLLGFLWLLLSPIRHLRQLPGLVSSPVALPAEVP
jgi:predicted MFS family arabinose efflux permease